MAYIKISELTAKSANLDSTDLFEVSEFDGANYVSKKITGQEIIDGVSSSVSDLPHAIASGTNTYTVTIPGVASYTDGDAYLIRFTNGSDADSTININSLGAIPLVKKSTIQITGGDIVANQELLIIYDGTNFQCLETTSNQLFVYVTNDDSVTITAGQPVYAFGASGNRMSVKLANNIGDTTSAQTVGLVFSSSIGPNQRGFVITQGVIDGLDTSMFSAGDQLYLGATAGALTNVKPYAPNHLVYIGIVERANAGNGQIYVKTQNGYELDEIHDVDLISVPPQNGDVLTFNSVTGLWEASPIPGLNTGGTQLLSGGASWSGTGMLFNVSDLTYTIDGNYYSATAQNVTLASGDPTFSRFDAIVVNAAGTVSVITGTPSANPIVPSILGTQVLIQYVLVAANATTPSITNEFVYREGTTPDWTPVAIAGGAPTLTANFSSLTPTPFQGTQCTLVNAPTYTTSKLVQYTKPSGNISRAAFPFLSFRSQLLAGSANRNIQVRLYNGSTLIGSAWSSSYGLSISTTGVWQLVVIPLTVFGNSGITTATRVQFLFSGTVVGTTQIALDDIKFQSGYGPQSSAATFDIAQNGTVIGDTSRLNFVDGTNTTVVVTDDIPNNKIDVKINASAITSLNGLTAASQTFAIGNAGTDFSIITSGSQHIFRLPTASAVNRGALSSADWTTFNNKIEGSGTLNYLAKFSPNGSTLANSLIFDNGTNIGINGVNFAPSDNIIRVFNSTKETTLYVENTDTTAAIGIGMRIVAYGSRSTNTNFGLFVETFGNTNEDIGIKSLVSGGINNYAAQLQDGSEAIGKFLRSMTTDGKANWSNIFNQIIEYSGTPVTQRNIINFQGAGVSVTDVPLSGKTTVTIAGTASLNNVVLVNSVSDLPTPSGGTITLAANTVYEFNTGSFNIGANYLTISDGTIIEGQSSFNTTLIYTGTGGAIRGTDVTFAARQIAIASPAGRVIDFTNVAQTKNLSFQNCVFSSQTSASVVTGYNIVFMSQTRFISCAGGINLVNNLGIAFELVVFNSTNSGTYITFTPTATTTAKFQNCDLEINTGNTGINVTSTAIASGIITGCDFKGTATVANRLVGVNGNTTGWNVAYGANTGIAGLQLIDIEISSTATALGNAAGTYIDSVKGYALPIASYDPFATVMEARTTALMTNAIGTAVQAGVYDFTSAAIVGGLGASNVGTNVAVQSNFIAITPNREYTGYYVKNIGASTRTAIKLTLKIY